MSHLQNYILNCLIKLGTHLAKHRHSWSFPQYGFIEMVHPELSLFISPWPSGKMCHFCYTYRSSYKPNNYSRCNYINELETINPMHANAILNLGQSAKHAVMTSCPLVSWSPPQSLSKGDPHKPLVFYWILSSYLHLKGKPKLFYPNHILHTLVPLLF